MSGNGTTASPWDALKSAIYQLGLAKNHVERNVRMQGAMSIARDIERGVGAEFQGLRMQFERSLHLLQELTGGHFVRFDVVFDPLLTPGEQVDVNIADANGAPVTVLNPKTLLIVPANAEPFVAVITRSGGAVQRNVVKLQRQGEAPAEQPLVVLG